MSAHTTIRLSRPFPAIMIEPLPNRASIAPSKSLTVFFPRLGLLAKALGA